MEHSWATVRTMTPGAKEERGIVTSGLRRRSDQEIIARAIELTARPPAATEAEYWRLDAEWDGSADHGHLVNTLI